MKNETCLECEGEITSTMCQQGQLFDGTWYPLHVGCAEVWLSVAVPVWTVSDGDGTGYTEIDAGNIKDMIESMDDGSEYHIERRTVRRGDYLRLPEFTGF